MTFQNRPITSIQQVQSELSTKKPQKSNQLPVQAQFGSILQQKLLDNEPVKFTKHANARLNERDITLSDEQMLKLQSGISQAKEKGIKESLMLMDNIALVVNVDNKTVITALDRQETKQHVFTNIDGAVIL